MGSQIFIGKGAKNNELILKILYEKGCLTAWGLAKELALLDPKKPRDIYHKAQKIQSLLVRKNGRLEVLVDKEFLKKTEKGYSLTINKGFCSALLFFDEENIPKPSIDFFSDIGSLDPALKVFAQLLSNLNLEQSKESYKELRKVTMGMLDKGLNFEKISNDEFGRFFNDEYEQFCLKLLKEGKKNPAHVEWTPELKEAAFKLIIRLTDMCQAQIKELENLSAEYRQKLEQRNLSDDKR